MSKIDAPAPSRIPEPPAMLMRFSGWFDWIAGQLLVAFLLGWQFGCVELRWNPPKAHGAPAPAYRAPPPLENRIEGGQNMHWGASIWTSYFSPQGFFGCSRGNEHWHGEWALDKNILTIRGRRLDEPESPESKWVVTLSRERQPRGGVVGVIEGGQEFALRPDPPARR